MNQYFLLKHIKAVTGHTVRLGMLESVADFKSSPDTIAVSLNRIHGNESRSGLRITKRGLDVQTFVRQPDETWLRLPAVVVWWSTSELHTSRRPSTPDREWADLCHRPGTDAFPMDNLDRVTQRELTGY